MMQVKRNVGMAQLMLLLARRLMPLENDFCTPICQR